MFSATDVNTLVEEIYNAQVAALNAKPMSGGGSSGGNSGASIVFGSQPSNVEVGTVWISGANVT